MYQAELRAAAIIEPRIRGGRRQVNEGVSTHSVIGCAGNGSLKSQIFVWRRRALEPVIRRPKWPPSCSLAVYESVHDPIRADSRRQAAMNYRTFTDPRGIRWEVWLVLPAAAERRAAERRVLADRRRESRAVAKERRVAVDRRHYTHRRLGVAPVFSNGWLCFESDEEKRRLAPVPPGWDNADAGELQAWCQAAKRVVKCGPGPTT